MDDSFGIGDECFLIEEEESSKRFISKPRKLLSERANFNGVSMAVDNNGAYAIDQQAKFPDVTPCTTEELVSIRAKMQYIAGCSRPDIAGPVHLLASEVKLSILRKKHTRKWPNSSSI